MFKNRGRPKGKTYWSGEELFDTCQFLKDTHCVHGDAPAFLGL